ncbi:hypothetical protein Acsp04_61470 [Actinomadura sp. NBRC 104425]|nr:hypothetical protein Acsp04_61470 [Actinomadura sp. NBRC 104425]
MEIGKLPGGKAAVTARAEEFGPDGQKILTAAWAACTSPHLRLLPQVEILRQILVHHYYWDADGLLRWRDGHALPPASLPFYSPYDTDARRWTGKAEAGAWRIQPGRDNGFRSTRGRPGHRERSARSPGSPSHSSGTSTPSSSWSSKTSLAAAIESRPEAVSGAFRPHRPRVAEADAATRPPRRPVLR